MSPIEQVLSNLDPDTRKKVIDEIKACVISGGDTTVIDEMHAAMARNPRAANLISRVHAEATRYGIKIEAGRVDAYELTAALKRQGKSPEERMRIKADFAFAGLID
jgi:hypothetical protein